MCEEMWRGVRVRGQVRTMNSVKDMSSKMSFDRKIKTMQARALMMIHPNHVQC